MKTGPDLKKDCNYELQARNYRDCWERNNCPFDNQMGFFALFAESFNTGTCMSQNCGQIARDMMCCLSQGYDDNPWSELMSAPLNCGSSILVPLAIALVVIAVLILVSFVVVMAGFLWYKFGRQKKEPFARLE